MFTSLLDLTKLEAGITTQRAVSVSLREMLSDITTMFREQARQRDLTLRMHTPRHEATVWADPALLRQAVVNLVHNALRYTGRGGILMGVRRRDACWQIEVWDTGVGIASEDAPHIFSPYFRNEHAWRIDSAGHGLGLAVVARCAKLLEAPLGYQSHLGQGSRFWLRLPMHSSAHQRTLPFDASLQAVPQPLRRLIGHCLVLDDDPQVLAAWRALLDSWGLTGCYATNAEEALRHLDAGLFPDAIFCDQRLRSGESGFEVFKLLLARRPQAVGAMISGEFHSLQLQEAEQEGYLVLRKPVAPAEIHGLLSIWLTMSDETETPS